MSIRRLETLCVGGLSAGEFLAGESLYCSVVRTKSVMDFETVSKMSVLDPPRLQETRYKRMALYYKSSAGDTRKFEFWVDDTEIHNEFDLLNALAQGYRPVTARAL